MSRLVLKDFDEAGVEAGTPVLSLQTVGNDDELTDVGDAAWSTTTKHHSTWVTPRSWPRTPLFHYSRCFLNEAVY